MRRPLSLLLLAVCACQGRDAAERASAGPPITESTPPYAEWSVGATPVTRIGAVDGPRQFQFSRIAYAARLSDGRVVVVDGGSAELRWYAADGAYQLQAGGRGEGPGEFLRVVGATVTPNDSIVLYDSRNQRLTWVGPDGSLSRTLRVELLGTVDLVPFDGGRLLIANERPVFNLGGAEFNSTRDSVLIMAEPGISQPLDTLMRRPGREAATWVQYRDGKPVGTRQFGLPFGHPTLIGAVADEVALIGDAQAALTFLNESGEVVRRARADVDPLPVSAALREQFVTNAIQRAEADGRPELPAKKGAEDLLEMVPEGQRMSPYDRLLVDPVAGRIWLRDHLFEWDATKAQHWTVFASTGEVLAQVATPPGLDVMQVGPTTLVGVERDALGVEHVAVYSFR